MDRDSANGCRWDGRGAGHYESWFQRANHPTRPLAFWIRYTLFVPRGRAADAVGERWAVWFDGEARQVTAVKDVVPYARCRTSGRGLDVAIADATLDATSLAGAVSCRGHDLSWSLSYTSPEEPLLLLPESMYTASFPRAKALVGSPLAVYTGSVTVDGTAQRIDGWIGSQNHNWGSRHTDRYAWIQVAGFDDAPRSFLEVGIAKVKLAGPLHTPWMTPIVLRHEGVEHRFNALGTTLRNHGRYGLFHADFSGASDEGTIEGHVEAPPDAFVGLPYDNPPGGRKTCLNTKIASSVLTFTPRGGAPVRLTTTSRAAFEILTDDHDHGVPVLGV